MQFKREIKSYVLRSRMTASQQVGFDKFWTDYGILAEDGILNFTENFQRTAPIIMEIGFGMGASLIKLAKQHPEINFLGIEVHKPGIGAVLAAIQELELHNVRLMCSDAINILKNNTPNNSLSGVLLFFPDPWPKRRHHKRRIVQPLFTDIIYQKLQLNGYFHMATDIANYADHMFKTVNNHSGFTIMSKNEDIPITLQRPKTKFELRGEKLGHPITDLVFVKTA